jgi:hypothetical protein
MRSIAVVLSVLLAVAAPPSGLAAPLSGPAAPPAGPAAATVASPLARIFWTDANWWGTATAEVGVARADGTGARPVVPATAGPSGVQQTGYLALDRRQTHVYWAEQYPEPAIWRVGVGGKAREMVVYGGSPFGVAVSSDYLYWTDTGDETIKRARLDGSGVRTLVRGLGVPESYIASPHDIAIDEAHGKMYWTTTARNAVQRANLDGTAVETIATTQYPEGIGLDLRGRRVYWVSGGCIHRVAMAGGAVERVLCTNGAYPVDVAVDGIGGYVYWSEADEEAQTGQIRRAHLDGTGAEPIVEAGLAFPWGLALTRLAADPSDFNGDGIADLAIGAPGERVAGHAGAGVVNVLYGRHGGLTAARDQYWTQDSPGVKGASERDDRFGTAVASGDFDGNGYADLAIGSFETARSGHGAVSVLYGSPTGLDADADQMWTPGLLGVGRNADIGAVLASGDFDGDGFWDLAVGAPQETIGSSGVYDRQGAVVVLRGGPAGLGTRGRQELTVLMAGPPDYFGYFFGSALAAGDLDGDGLADLAVGAPGAITAAPGHPAYDAGLVAVFSGTSAGLSTNDARAWSQASPGIPGDQAGYESFGASLAIGDFDADGYGDLAVGVPQERLATTDPSGYAGDYVGGVNVLYGSSAGLTANGSQLWHQDAPGVPGSNELYDTFGAALAAGDFDGDGADDLAIGNPVDRVRGVRAGAVTVLRGSSSGLTAEGASRWTQASPSVPGAPEARDGFGAVLASADYGRSGPDDLAIGVPGDRIGTTGHDGMAIVLYGSAAGLDAAGAQGWSQNTLGVLGISQRLDGFGTSLTP